MPRGITVNTRGQTEELRAAMAQRLREAREYVGLSQEEVAQALGVSRPAVTNIETGNRKVEAVELDKLATLYRQSVTFLLSGEDAVGAVPAQVQFLARAVKGLSQKDMEEVARFASFLKRSSDAKTGKKPQK
ncbi:transcriptional regulator [Pseudoxanthomonas kaohsiungensis]|nr:transcriptional regulator [Pseudoxanthomonas kaohsiungensis]